MKEFTPPESHYLRAASGWLELGSPREARAELQRLSPPLSAHPDVLEVLWQIEAAERSWVAALEIAERLIGADADRPTGWINRSFSLHELRRTQEAWEKLLPAADRFPAVPTIPYNLACYACQLGRSEEAKVWLARAAELQDWPSIKAMAAQDLDLLPLRDYVASVGAEG